MNCTEKQGVCASLHVTEPISAKPKNIKIKIMDTQHLKWQCQKIFQHIFISLIQPIWAPDKQLKIISLKNSFSQRYANFQFKQFESFFLTNQPFKTLTKMLGYIELVFMYLKINLIVSIKARRGLQRKNWSWQNCTYLILIFFLFSAWPYKKMVNPDQRLHTLKYTRQRVIDAVFEILYI